MSNERTIKVPTYMQGFVRATEEEGIYTVVSSAGNDHLEIWYHGHRMEDEGCEGLIIATETTYSLIVAIDPATKEQILLFDGVQHGHDNLFCTTHDDEDTKDRALQKLDIPPSVILFQPYYSIDFEEERDIFETNEDGDVILVDGGTMPWDEVVVNAMDWLAIFYIDADGNAVDLVSEELA